MNIKLTKLKNFILLLIFSLFSYQLSFAQSWKKEIETSIESLNKAIISQDKTALENLTSNELSYGHSTGLVENKSEFIQAILSGPVKFSIIGIENQSINPADDLAIVRHITTIVGVKDGMPLNLKIGILMIWKKQGDHWQLLARQGYKLP